MTHRVAGALALALLVLAAACSSPSEPDDAGPDELTGQLFGEDSPWNTPVPDDPALDEDSEEMIAALVEDGGAVALLDEYAVPVYEATEDTPFVEVRCTQDWGDCPLEDQPVPIPADAEASSGSDGAMVVIDHEAGRVYDFWQAERADDGAWTASWGTHASLDGDGIGGESGGAAGGSTGAGINLLAGLVRLEEIREGEIAHALAFASDLSCPGEYRYPATKTDGHAESGTCLPQGARLQLDPSIDVESIPGITAGEVAVAKALQTYGGYLRDSSEAALAVAFERAPEGEEAYAEIAEFPWDFYRMAHIPWDRLRVLETWDGTQ
ncbi:MULTISPECIES: hypothetical protein [unclassified Blastococcus]